MATIGTTHFDGTEFGSKQAAELRALRRREIDDVAFYIINTLPAVQGAWLFGSHVDNTHSGAGVIRLVLVSDALHGDWINWLPRTIDSVDLEEAQDLGYSSEEREAMWRLNGLLAITGHDVEDAWSSGFPLFHSQVTPRELDVFVLPTGWHKTGATDFLRDSGYHLAPNPLTDLASGMVEFNQSAGTFWPSGSH